MYNQNSFVWVEFSCILYADGFGVPNRGHFENKLEVQNGRQNQLIVTTLQQGKGQTQLKCCFICIQTR